MRTAAEGRRHPLLPRRAGPARAAVVTRKANRRAHLPGWMVSARGKQRAAGGFLTPVALCCSAWFPQGVP